MSFLNVAIFCRQKQPTNWHQAGFTLPTVMIVSLIMVTILVFTMQFVSTSQASLTRQYHLQLAREAAESGLAYAEQCMALNNGIAQWSSSKPLRPNTDCEGTVIPGADEYVLNGNLLRTLFSIGAPIVSGDGKMRTISSSGVIQILRRSDNQVRHEYTQYARAYAGTSSVSQIMTSSSFACSLVEPSQVYCWGQNVYDVLGENVTPTAMRPSRIDTAPALAGKTVTKLAEGSYSARHMCVIVDGASQGEVYCWGNNSFGQLGNGVGDGSLRTSPQPVKVGGLLSGKQVTQVVVGERGTCAIASDGVYCWGSNADGQLGHNNSGQSISNVPVRVSGITTAQSLSFGDRHVCAVSGGRIYCWGWGQWGQLGHGSTGTSANRYAATRVDGLLSGKTATAVSANHATTCAVANNEVYCWGNNGQGSLGNGTFSDSYVPAKVVNGSGKALHGKTVVQLSGGDHYACGRTSDGKVYCWGGNRSVGALGNNDLDSRHNEPVETQLPTGQGPATYLSSSGNRSCVIMNKQTYCWGAAYDGQLRLGVQEPKLVNNGFIKDKNAKYIAAGDGTTCVTVGTRVSCWGRGGTGQLGNDASDNSSAPVAVSWLVGTMHGLSTSGGTVCAVVYSSFYCWGQNIAGKVGNNTVGNENRPQKVYDSGVLSGRTAQIVGTGHHFVSCGVADEKVHCWGGYASAVSVSALGNNKTLQSGTATYYVRQPVEVYRESGVLSGKTVTALSDGGTCVVASARVYCWGSNVSGNLGIGTFSSGSSKPVAVLTESGVLQNKTPTVIETGGGGDRQYTCVATTEPNIYCWGYNFDGQYGDGTRTASSKPRLVTTAGHPLKGKTITKLAAGDAHTCALTDGEVYCWGYNSFGQLGDGTNASQLLPQKVRGVLAGKVVTDISAGGANTCAIADARVHCWGSNDYGQIGDGTTQAAASPTPTKALAIPPFLMY